MKNLKITLFTLLLASTCTFAQTKPKAKAKAAPKTQAQAQQSPKITVPLFNDTYCKLVKHIEAGNTAVNYEELRMSFLNSEQFKVASEKTQEYNRLKDLLAEQIEKKQFSNVITTAKQMLSINYTSLYAHRGLWIGYLETGNTKNSNQYGAIEKGLLESITTRGNGSSCQNAWPVIQEEEEYYILSSLDAGIVSNNEFKIGGVCEEFHTMTTDGKKKKYYFETTRLEEGKRLLTPPEEVNTGN